MQCVKKVSPANRFTFLVSIDIYSTLPHSTAIKGHSFVNLKPTVSSNPPPPPAFKCPTYLQVSMSHDVQCVCALDLLEVSTEV